MAASQAISAFGTQLQIGDGATPEAFTTVSEVTKLSGPKRSVNTVEFLTHASPGAAIEKLGVSINNGTVDLELNYVPSSAVQARLITDMNAFTKRNFKLIFPDAAATTWSFAAIVTSFETTEDPDGVLVASLSLDISGQVS